MQSVSLTLDGESHRYEWNQYSKQWECNNGFEPDLVVPEIMSDFFTQPGADFLHAQSRVDDLLLDFEWLSGKDF